MLPGKTFQGNLNFRIPTLLGHFLRSYETLRGNIAQDSRISKLEFPGKLSSKLATSELGPLFGHFNRSYGNMGENTAQGFRISKLESSGESLPENSEVQNPDNFWAILSVVAKLCAELLPRISEYQN